MKIPILWADDDIFEKDKSEGMTFRQPKGGKELPREKAIRLNSRQHGSAESKRPKKMKTHQAPSDSRSSSGVRGPQDKTSSHARPDAAKVLALPKRQHTKKQSRKHTISHPGRSSTPEERIAYYKKKYGDDFKSLPKDVKQTVKHCETTKKKSLLRKIINCLAK